MKQLSDEKNNLDKKYISLLVDVKKFINETEKKALEENLSRLNDSNERSQEIISKQTEALRNEVEMLKTVQKS